MTTLCLWTSTLSCQPSNSNIQGPFWPSSVEINSHKWKFKNCYFNIWTTHVFLKHWILSLIIYLWLLSENIQWCNNFLPAKNDLIQNTLFNFTLGLFVLLLYVLFNSYGHGGMSVHLTKFFLWASLNKQLPVLRAHTFGFNWQQPFLNKSAEGRRMTIEIISWLISMKVWDQAGIKRDPWICSLTCICSQTSYRLRYWAWFCSWVDKPNYSDRISMCKQNSPSSDGSYRSRLIRAYLFGFLGKVFINS